MIHVDETDPVGEIEPPFPCRDVTIKRNTDVNDNYEMLSEIGRGKFGTVYLCREKSTGLELAAKLVSVGRRDERRNVEREVDVMRRLRHPRLIQLYDAYEWGKHMCVVLELITGGELFERVIDEDFVLTERACTVFMRQICEGIEFVHRQNILHLDMKNRNNPFDVHQIASKIRLQNVLLFFLRRPWLGVPIGLWLTMGSALYYWWLLSRISILDSQNRTYSKQIYNAPRVMSVDSNFYQAPILGQGSICETIHISLVCMGQCMSQITPMLKSLLYHRQNPIHFYFIVDTSSDKALTKLFDTWELPDVKISCYNAQYDLPKVAWIPNSHYSGVYIFFKLLCPDVLPKSLQKVIVLDSDLTFLSDVAELWNMFRNMTGEQLIGLVENESNWYYEADRWPALGRGYNTGVMLLDLHKIRTTTNWTLLWHEAVQLNIKKLTKTSLGDQDVLNAVIHKYPHIVYNISCQYNVQMSTLTLAKNCYGDDVRNVKIVHWNSPRKYAVDVRDAGYFRDLHMSFANMDGGLLNNKIHRCWPVEATTVTPSNTSNLCTSFRAAARATLRTHIYYKDFSYTTGDAFDVTLVLQLSMDRILFLERVVRFWEGPISAAIYLADCELKQLDLLYEMSTTLNQRKNIGYHLVFKRDVLHYPVNYLRNVALQQVNTPYVFLMDVDFVPMTDLYQHLKDAIKLVNPYPQKKCLVVAAFETQCYRASPPRTKAALRARLLSSEGDVAPFRLREWPRGHRATNYSAWLTATKPYEVEWESDYEPYLVVHRSVPEYDTRFSGFGWNKVSHIVELRAQGYRAVVLPDAFVVHTTHAPSAGILAFRANKHYRICLVQIKQEFLNDLQRKYNVTFDMKGKQKDEFSQMAHNLLLNQAKDSA